MASVFSFDSVRGAIEAAVGYCRNTILGQSTPFMLTPQMAIGAYLSSGMLRKVINIPAHDRVREWRDWQADKDQIAAIEAEEKRLGLREKIKFAEVLRGLGGGALILVTPGDMALPVNTRAISRGGLTAINVVSRWQLTLHDIDNNLVSPTHGLPAYFEVPGGGAQACIHPSRVVCFRGDAIPYGAHVNSADAFWGASRLQAVLGAALNSDDAQTIFAALLKKAKLTRVGIPGLSEHASTAAGKARLDARIATMALGESHLNATLYEAGDPEHAETINDYQLTWTGIPQVMDAFDQRLSSVADIPLTRLAGRSPAGMNATGQHDTDNWNKMVVAGQNLETRPCVEQIDVALLPSAGVAPDKVTWNWAPLDTPSENEQATTFDKTMDAVTKLQNTGAIPEEAFAKGLQNLMSEREWMPGLDQALAEIPEAERYGITPPAPDPNALDPSALQAANENTVATMKAKGAITGDQALALLADAAPRSLYVSRKLVNAAEIIAWAKGQGFSTTTPADELHVTVCFSRQPVDWMKMGTDWGSDDKGQVTVPPGGARLVERLGDKGAVVLLFNSSALSWRHEEFERNGASFDFQEYQPHVTISYDVPADFDLSKVEPYQGKLVFGPEIFAEAVEDWKKGVVEA